MPLASWRPHRRLWHSWRSSSCRLAWGGSLLPHTLSSPIRVSSGCSCNPGYAWKTLEFIFPLGEGKSSVLGFWRLRQTANERRYIGAVVRPVFPLHMSVGFGRQWLKNANQCLNFRFPCLTWTLTINLHCHFQDSLFTFTFQSYFEIWTLKMKKSPFSSSPLKHWDIELEPEFWLVNQWKQLKILNIYIRAPGWFPLAYGAGPTTATGMWLGASSKYFFY